MIEFLYIFQDIDSGEFWYQTAEPSPKDWLKFRDGDLNILRVSKDRVYECLDNTWEPMRCGRPDDDL